MTRFIFVRHGQSTANKLKIFAGHHDVDLTELGHMQAQMTAEYIYNNYKVDSVYASDLLRAFSTGKYIADRLGVEIIPDRRLREIYAGKWDGQPFDFAKTTYPDDFLLWDQDIGNARCSGGESVKELGARIFEAVSDIAEKNIGKTVVVATHATPIKCLMCLASGGDYNNMKSIPWVSNSSVSIVRYENGKIVFETDGYDAHLGEFSSCHERGK